MKGASGETINPYIAYPQLPKSYLPLWLLSGRMSGPCVVIGGGASARSVLRQNSFDNVFAIACNHAVEHHPSDIVVCQDSHIFKHQPFVRAVETRKTFAVTSLSRPTSRLSTERTSGFYFWRESCNDNREWLNSDPCHVLKSPSVLSGSQAVVIAHALGFYPIICLGFDASSKTDSYSYGFKHPKWGDAMPQTKARQQMIDKQSEFLSCNAHELNLVNCGLGSWSRRIDPKKVSRLLQPNRDTCRRIIESLWLANMDASNPRAADIYRNKRNLRSNNQCQVSERSHTNSSMA